MRAFCASIFLFALPIAADHYRALGVARGATADQVKAAYKKLALKHHPDKHKRSATSEERKRSSRTFEAANAAYEVLGDAAMRRQYDYELSNPTAAGAASSGAAAARPQRPLVRVTVLCTLEQLGGWSEAAVSLSSWSSALGAPVTAEVARRLGLPLRLPLPPGARSGDYARHVLPGLGPAGIDVDFELVALPHRRWARRDAELSTTVTLPAWHNWLRRRVWIRGIDGESIVIRERGEAVPPPSRGGADARVPGRGMPLRHAAEEGAPPLSPWTMPRGDLLVRLRLRPVLAEVGRAIGRLSGVAALAAAAPRAAAVARRLPEQTGRLAEEAAARGALAVDWLGVHVLGRARPAARRARAEAARARAEARRRSARRRAAERGATESRAVREERWRRLRAVREERWRRLRAVFDRLGARGRAWWEWAWG